MCFTRISDKDALTSFFNSFILKEIPVLEKIEDSTIDKPTYYQDIHDIVKEITISLLKPKKGYKSLATDFDVLYSSNREFGKLKNWPLIGKNLSPSQQNQLQKFTTVTGKYFAFEGNYIVCRFGKKQKVLNR